MLHELRSAVHRLRHAPLFAGAATVALAVGIGANATIFGLIDGLWLRPPAVAHPSRLDRIFATTTGPSAPNARSAWSFPEYLAIRDRSRSFDAVVALGRRGAVVARDDGSSDLVLANVTSLNFFTALGVTAAHGRLFTSDDEATLEADPGVVLAHAYWRREFGGDPAVIGRLIRVDRGQTTVPLRVLAVLPASFRDVEAAGDRDLWLPVPAWARLGGAEEFTSRNDRWFEILGTRRAGVDATESSAEIAVIAAGLEREFPATNSARGGRAQSDRAYRLEEAGPMAAAVLTLVLLVVLITCVNVVHLVAARSADRTRELATRLALGASRWQVARERLAEVLLLGGCGTAAGLALAAGLIRLIPSVLVPPPGFSAFAIFALDGRVLLFTLAIASLSTAVVSLAPAASGPRADIVTLIKDGAGPRPARAWSHRLLLVGQLGLSVILLYTAAMLGRSFLETRRADIGFERSPILTVWLPFGDAPRALVAEAQHSVARLPGVIRAAIAIRAPLSLSGGGLAQPVIVPAVDPSPVTPPNVKYNAVSSNYFETMGTRIVRGRSFTPLDEGPGEAVVVVNEAFARVFFQGEAVGRLVRLGGPAGADHRIVGVVENALIVRFGERVEPYFYLPFARTRTGEATLLVAGDARVGALAPIIRDTLPRLDRRLSPRRQILLSDLIDFASGDYRAAAALAVMLASIGLLLTTVGVYGVIALRTARRTKELAIRIALGASHTRVLGLVLGDSARLTIAGIAIGAPLALGGVSRLGSMLLGVPSRDGFTLAGCAALLLAIVLAATFGPAWRAARTQPTMALRDR
jgi:predicted permease